MKLTRNQGRSSGRQLRLTRNQGRSSRRQLKLTRNSRGFLRPLSLVSYVSTGSHGNPTRSTHTLFFSLVQPCKMNRTRQPEQTHAQTNPSISIFRRSRGSSSSDRFHQSINEVKDASGLVCRGLLLLRRAGGDPPHASSSLLVVLLVLEVQLNPTSSSSVRFPAPKNFSSSSSPRPDGDPLGTLLLLPLPLLLGPPRLLQPLLPRFIDLDLLLPALLATERHVTSAIAKRAPSANHSFIQSSMHEDLFVFF